MQHAIRGMRNPLNSWGKSDSHYCEEDCPHVMNNTEPAKECDNGACVFCIGTNDHNLMHRLVKAGSDHSKFMRMITVYVDITAPLYWWKEFDTYKVGTVANSCSTMHKIHAKEFTLDDFSFERCHENCSWHLESMVGMLNIAREKFLKTNNKVHWDTMIQILPSSYNQKRTVMLNYAVLRNMYHARKSHKLDEWRKFCEWIEMLPYSELITEDYKNER